MRTLLFLANGFLLAGACRLLVRLFISVYPTVTVVLPALFAVLWFAIALTNMIAGITKAGYGFFEELPIFLLIFLPPAIVLFWPAVK
ncbi:membrane protein [[Pantoea] beijingensis]|uniref:Membrane protein n=1 Tax=[Pantoea] beijingensis TaxID=1324864 RepID=A0A443IE13_9GAMM|nr:MULTISPECIES: hypothetical protein [Erwiniaceae]RWR02226.1 membrane protein [[Pantoea] beijingensis]